jgi:hypothetical protein
VKGLDAACFPFCDAAKVAAKDATNSGQKLAVNAALKGWQICVIGFVCANTANAFAATQTHFSWQPSPTAITSPLTPFTGATTIGFSVWRIKSCETNRTLKILPKRLSWSHRFPQQLASNRSLQELDAPHRH